MSEKLRPTSDTFEMNWRLANNGLKGTQAEHGVIQYQVCNFRSVSAEPTKPSKKTTAHPPKESKVAPVRFNFWMLLSHRTSVCRLLSPWKAPFSRLVI